MIERLFTVVRVKAACPNPVAGSPVFVLAVDRDELQLEWRTTEAPAVGDQFVVSVRRMEQAGVAA